MYYKTYCFALQKRRFYTVKAAVLHCKTAAFTMPNRNCRFLSELSLQKRSRFHVLLLKFIGTLGKQEALYKSSFPLMLRV